MYYYKLYFIIIANSSPKQKTKGYSCRFQIKQWLNKNEVESFVIIDDLIDMRELNQRLVLTDVKDGLQEYHKPEFFEILNTPYEKGDYEEGWETI